MTDFIEAVSIGKKNYYFSFRKISTPKGFKFFVTTSENSDIISFEIRKDGQDKWNIVEPVPKWIQQIEKTLFDIIQTHLKNSN